MVRDDEAHSTLSRLRRARFSARHAAARHDRPASEPPRPRRTSTAASRASDAGQATVELVAVLPLVAAVLAALWQLALVGYAEWAANVAARAAARADAVGADPVGAARAHLGRSLERGLRVRSLPGGAVRVAIRIPTLPGLPSIGHARATGHFEPQS
jgi:hypothetical protein